MKLLFNLSKQDVKLSAAEVLALSAAKKHELYDNLLVIDSSFSDFGRLAYTKAVYELLFISSKKTLIKDFSGFNWQKIYNSNFCVRQIDTEFDEKSLGEIVWRKLKNPKVKLAGASTEIHLFKKKSMYFCCRLLKDLGYDYDDRKAHNRPAMHPSSLHPRLARALINLTGIKSGTLTDPFCGTGGILIEAGMIGLKPVGYDIDEMMIERAKANLIFFNIKGCILEKKDATMLTKKISYIATDLPYGRNTSVENLNRLYSQFIERLDKILAKKAVVIFPDFIDAKKLLKKHRFAVENEFIYYLHKSLSKRIVLLSKMNKK